MRRRRRPSATFSLSLLDLLCCAFGGVIIMAVVFSASMRPATARATRLPTRLTVLLEQGEWPPGWSRPQFGVSIIAPDGNEVVDWLAEPPVARTGSVVRRSSTTDEQTFLLVRLGDVEPGYYDVAVRIAAFPFGQAKIDADIPAPLTVTSWPTGNVQVITWDGYVDAIRANPRPAEVMGTARVCVPDQQGNGCAAP